MYEYVDGAPVQVGDTVHVVSASDDTCDFSFLGLTGTVEFLEYECGCGQTYPCDPMIGVRLPDGRLDEFWAEEIILFPFSMPRDTSVRWQSLNAEAPV